MKATTMKYLAALLSAGLAFGATAAVAHSKKEATTPANGAVLQQAPETIGMTFDTPMRVTLVRLTDSAGVEIDISRTGGMTATPDFVATPAALSTGEYTVEWRGLSGDGHPMQGSFSFTVAD